MFGQYPAYIKSISEKAFGPNASPAVVSLVFCDLFAARFKQTTERHRDSDYFIDVLDARWAHLSGRQEASQLILDVEDFVSRSAAFLEADLDEEEVDIVVEPMLVLEELAGRSIMGETVELEAVLWYGLRDLFMPALVEELGVSDAGDHKIPDDMFLRLTRSQDLLDRLILTSGALAALRIEPAIPVDDVRRALGAASASLARKSS